ncbi:hypothetical protein [Sphingomonas sp.]|uniref:hypothetical protein n=1 Tax=Sphingomonas sp. TaxID=28214 RepID=UPI003B00FAAD
MIVRLVAAGAAMILAGCEAPARVDNQAAANTATPIASEDPNRFEQFAACASTMTALSRLYSSLATQETGAARTDMLERARARGAGSAAFHDYAVTQATAAGKTAADVDRIQRQKDGVYATAVDQQPLEQFARMLARDGDACKALSDSAV